MQSEGARLRDFAAHSGWKKHGRTCQGSVENISKFVLRLSPLESQCRRRATDLTQYASRVIMGW